MEILALYADTHNTAVLASLNAEKSLEADGMNQVSGANDKEPVEFYFLDWNLLLQSLCIIWKREYFSWN